MWPPSLKLAAACCSQLWLRFRHHCNSDIEIVQIKAGKRLCDIGPLCGLPAISAQSQRSKRLTQRSHENA